MSVVAVKQQALLECRAIGKNFGGVAALEGVDFDLHQARCMALLVATERAKVR